MEQRRTDLALEAAQLWREGGNTGELPGVTQEESIREGYPVTTVKVLDDRGAKAIGKPVGTYVTVDLSALVRREEDAFGRAARAVAAELNALLKLPEGAPALVVGLGNRAMTPDVVGPKAVDYTLVTRHLVEGLPQFGHLRPVAALAPGVLGTTGMESGAVVEALVEQLRPACVLAIDALAARSVHRLCRTVQLSDTGIVPGSGVGNHRRGLTEETLGVPVVSLGVPTVVDGATLIEDLLGESTPADVPGRELFVTPREVDSRVADLSRVLGYGVSRALNPSLSVEELNMLIE